MHNQPSSCPLPPARLLLLHCPLLVALVGGVIRTQTRTLSPLSLSLSYTHALLCSEGFLADGKLFHKLARARYTSLVNDVVLYTCIRSTHLHAYTRDRYIEGPRKYTWGLLRLEGRAGGYIARTSERASV